MEPSFGAGIRHRQRNRRRRGVAHPVDIAVDLVVSQPEALADRLNDPLVGLVGNEEIDLTDRHSRLVEHLQAELGQRPYRHLEGLVPPHLDER